MPLKAGKSAKTVSKNISEFHGGETANFRGEPRCHLTLKNISVNGAPRIEIDLRQKHMTGTSIIGKKFSPEGAHQNGVNIIVNGEKNIESVWLKILNMPANTKKKQEKFSENGELKIEINYAGIRQDGELLIESDCVRYSARKVAATLYASMD